jgi:hypothetical protein
LALALVASYLDRGASWVEPETAAWSDWSAHTPAIPPTLLAQASTPGNLVWSALDDPEGTWSPATTLVREGQEAILGLDRASLQEHLAADTAEDVFEALETATATAILAVLERRSENHVLRAFVYDQLQGRAQFELLEAVARPFAKRSDAWDEDLVRWFAVRSEGVAAGSEADALTAELLDVLARHPRNAELYEVLAVVYGRNHPEDPESAAACWHRIRELVPWGAINQRATLALEELRTRSR